MEQTPHKYATMAYELYADNEQGIHELLEKVPAEHPYQFISGIGTVLEKLEEKILETGEGGTFDFVIKEDDAFGPYLEEHVIERPKEDFSINGRFDKEMIYPGAVIPLVNSDGLRFEGIVLDVTDSSVTVDLNHPFAGKDLHFKGQVITLRDATDAEVQGAIQMMSGEGCGCGCDDCGHEHHGECGDHCCGGHCHE